MKNLKLCLPIWTETVPIKNHPVSSLMKSTKSVTATTVEMETYHEKFWVLVKAGLHLSQFRAEQNNNHENERSRTILYNATILSPCLSQWCEPFALDMSSQSQCEFVVCPCKCLQQPTSQVPLHSWGPLTLLSILPLESEHKHITLKPRNHPSVDRFFLSFV